MPRAHQDEVLHLRVLETARLTGESLPRLKRLLDAAQHVRVRGFGLERLGTDLVAVRRLPSADDDRPRWQRVALESAAPRRGPR